MGSGNIMCILYIVCESAVRQCGIVYENIEREGQRSFATRGEDHRVRTKSRQEYRREDESQCKRECFLAIWVVNINVGGRKSNKHVQGGQESTQAARTTRTEAIYGKDNVFGVVGLVAITKHKHDRAMASGPLETLSCLSGGVRAEWRALYSCDSCCCCSLPTLLSFSLSS